MKVPSGFPGSSPSAWNCRVRYATAFSSPGVPGARPSMESAERSLMCWRRLSAEIARAAVKTSESVAAESVKGAEDDELSFDWTEQAAETMAARAPTTLRVRGMMSRELGSLSRPGESTQSTRRLDVRSRRTTATQITRRTQKQMDADETAKLLVSFSLFHLRNLRNLRHLRLLLGYG